MSVILTSMVAPGSPADCRRYSASLGSSFPLWLLASRKGSPLSQCGSQGSARRAAYFLRSGESARSQRANASARREGPVLKSPSDTSARSE